MRARLAELDEWKLADRDQDIRGKELRDSAGKTLGRIQALIVETDRQEVDSVLLESGREIPVEAIDIRNDGRDVILSSTYMDGQVSPQQREAGSLREGFRRIPVIEEKLVVGKREREAGMVRVESHVTEQPVEEKVQLHEEHATIERRPVNREAAPGALDRAQDQSIEIREMAEEPVVQKTARVVEEVVVSKDTSERTETIRDTVRHSEVEVDESDSGHSGSQHSSPRRGS